MLSCNYFLRLHGMICSINMIINSSYSLNTVDRLSLKHAATSEIGLR